MELPITYQERMKDLLGADYPAYLAALDEPRLYGLRVNTAKISVEEFERIAPFPVRRIPYVPNGFFYDGETVQPAKHPYYFAGLYYLQDPSAMTPASRLPIEEGNRVLDLCAAPGGKSTELAARLCGNGLLVANDISASRAKALQKNIELFGIKNSLITTEYPEKLASFFPGFFDRILIDAPCSGEGMFRKDPAMIRSWSEDSPAQYAAMQEDIVRHALPMLAPGGYLLYSTCTFSPLEDEGSVRKILAMDPSLSLVPMEGYEGFAPGFDGLTDCVRIFPHRMEGEGHFLALFRRGEAQGTAADDLTQNTSDRDDDTQAPSAANGPDSNTPARGNTPTGKPTRTRRGATPSASSRLSRDERAIWEAFAADLNNEEWPPDQIESHDGKLFLNVPGLPEVRGLRFLRNGLYLGECKKNRFEPSQALAMALRADDYVNTWNLAADDERVIRYLKGETLRIDTTQPAVGQAESDSDPALHQTQPADPAETRPRDGNVLICVDGYPLGWGKKSASTVKNKYHSGWRLM